MIGAVPLDAAKLGGARLAIAYAACLIVFLALDIGWITLVVQPMYKSQLGALVRDKPALPAGVAFYLLYLVGLLVFAVAPALRAQSWSPALLNGALFGFFTYMTFALTNLSVIRGWTLPVAISDIAWGVMVSAATAVAAYAITAWLRP